jgi:hypothetical protein
MRSSVLPALLVTVLGVAPLAAGCGISVDKDGTGVLDYYKRELAKYGPVSECHGNLDFKDSLSAPRCKPRSRDDVQLGAGREHDNHIVSVKTRGTGTEFTLIHVQTRG